jgi:hypothetical protein
MLKLPADGWNPLYSPTQAPSQQLRSLNVDFLRLLRLLQGRKAGKSSQFELRLTAMQSKAFGSCDLDALQRMADCGFSLYSLSLHCAHQWQRLAEYSARAAALQRKAAACAVLESSFARNAATPLTTALLNFMNCAVFFAWHLAQQADQTARLMLGMCDESSNTLRAMDLWQCGYVAQHYQQLLTPRWQFNRYFWPDILRYGLNAEVEYLRFAQLLGTQLIAQDLEPGALAMLCINKPE